MTKYRLKDAELQKKLDVISDGDFSRQIESRLQTIRGCGTTDADYRLFFGELPGRYEIVNRFSMLLYEHEIEVFEDYDPNAWNNYPETQPPMDLHMRVETATGFKCCAEFDGEDWMYRSVGENGVQGLRVLKNVVRYRPWSKP